VELQREKVPHHSRFGQYSKTNPSFYFPLKWLTPPFAVFSQTIGSEIDSELRRKLWKDIKKDLHLL
jgi:hypothetical protein